MTSVDVWSAIGGGGRQARKVLFGQGLVGFVLIILLLTVKHAIAAGETANFDPLASMPGVVELAS